ncbi:MAG: TIGR02147 family protein [Bdellovibrionota bacterium]
MHDIRKKIEEIAGNIIKASSYLDYKLYLQDVYNELKQHKNDCSYTAFSEALGLSKTNVAYLIIKGQRPLTVKNGEKIAAHLKLKGIERKYFLGLVKYYAEKDPLKKEKIFSLLVNAKNKTLNSAVQKQQLEFYSEWYHSAIFELVHLSAAVSDAHVLAKMLEPNIRPEQAKKSLALLESLKLIQFDRKSNRYIISANSFSAENVLAHVAISRYHQKMIELAKESLVTMKAKKRDISAITFSIPEGRLYELKEEVKKFRKKVLAITENTIDSEIVYQMNIQLFPISKPLYSRNEHDEEI